MVITEDIIHFKKLSLKLKKLLQKMFKFLSVLFVTLFTAVTLNSQVVVRPLQVGKFDRVESQTLSLRKGIFTGKALSIDSTAKSSQIPSALAVYNYVNAKQSIESYTTVTDTANLSVSRGTTVFDFASGQANLTITLPADSVSGSIVWLIFADTVTAVTVSAPAGQTIGGTALTTAVGGSTVASYIYIGAPVRRWFRRD